MRRNKSDLVNAIVKRTTIPIQKERVSEILDIVMDEIVRTVSNGNELILSDFGQFKRTHKPSRKSKNLQTGEPMIIEEYYTPTFAAGKRFKDMVRGR